MCKGNVWEHACAYLMYIEEKKKSRIWAVQIDNLRGLKDIKRIDRIINIWVRELCGKKKWIKVFSNGFDIMKEWRILGWGGVYEVCDYEVLTIKKESGLIQRIFDNSLYIE